MDFVAVIEEIALEGLDGITIEALWKRLEDRPGFVDGSLDDDTKHYIWRNVVDHEDVRIYKLPEPRPELVIFKYNAFVQRGNVKCTLPPDFPEDIYSRKIINKDGYNGCCDTFDTRVDITEEFRTSSQDKFVTLEDAVTRYGQTLVFVACQLRRNLLLTRSNDVSVSPEHYAFLEIIGRGRYDGEVTFCRLRRGLCNPIDKQFCLPSASFTRVSALENFGLVTKQIFIMTYMQPHWVNQVRLVHLIRFHTTTNANFRGVVKDISGYLVKCPDWTAPFYNVMADLQMKPDVFHRVNKRVKSYFTIRNVQRSNYFKDDEKFAATTKANEKQFLISLENRVKVIHLMKVYQDQDKLDEDDDFNDVKPDIDETGDVKCSFPTIDCSILNQAVSLVYKCGETGIAPACVASSLNLSRTNMKYVDKELLVNTKVVGSFQRAHGKIRESVWLHPDVALDHRTRQADLKREVKDTLEQSIESTAAGVSTVLEDVISPEEEARIDARLQEINLTGTVQRVDTIKVSTEEDDHRRAERKKHILNCLTVRKVYPSLSELYREIIDMEKSRGMKERMCRKSIKRIITQLYEEGSLEYLNVVLETKNGPQERQMIILPGAGLNNPHTKKAVVEHATAKLRCKETESHLKDAMPPSHQDVNFTCYSVVAELGLVSVYKMLIEPVSLLKKKSKMSQKSSCRINKMERAESLLEYLHYLIYGYKGVPEGESTIEDDLEEIEGTLPVHLDVNDWRRYLPPLKFHNASALKKIKACPGSCMIGDIMLQMPLSKVWNMLNRSAELKEVLGHWVEERRLLNIPVCRVPPIVLVELVARKRFLSRLIEDLTFLCYLGLLSFGPKQSCNNMEFNSIYLHKHATLLDTRCSQKSYLMTKCPDEVGSFPKLHYKLETSEDLEQYWIDFQTICLNTQLGARKQTDVPGSHGELTLVQASKTKTFEQIREIDETNWLPGDRRGAAGIDSYLMCHSLRNWKSMLPRLVPSKKLKQIVPPPVPLLKCFRQPKQPSRPTEKTKAAKTSASASGSKKDEPPAKRKKVIRFKGPKTEAAMSTKRKQRLAQPPERKPKNTARRRYSDFFDERDRQAQRGRSRIRTVFTPLENGQLLLCQLACAFLNPRTQVIRTSLIRDIIQENIPEASDKTTYAIKGKIARLGSDLDYNLHLATYLAQAKSDKKLVAKYDIDLPPIMSNAMNAIFIDLFKDLKAKFSGSAFQTPKACLPASVKELTDTYVLMKAMEILFEPSRQVKPINSVLDIHIFVASEMIQTLFHLEKSLPAPVVYFILSKFTNCELEAAYRLLMNNGIIIRIKSVEKDRAKVIANSALLNNHKLKRLHEDTLKSLIPSNVFPRMMQVLDSLPRASLRPPQAISKKSNDGKGSTSTSTDKAHSSSNISDDHSYHHSTQRAEDATEKPFIPLDVGEFQGGGALAAVCLSTLGMLSMKLSLPKEAVLLDQVGERKLGLRQTAEKRFIKGRAFRAELQGRTRKRPLDKADDDEDDDEDYREDGEHVATDTPIFKGQRRPAIQEVPPTQNAKISLQRAKGKLAQTSLQTSNKPRSRFLTRRPGAYARAVSSTQGKAHSYDRAPGSTAEGDESTSSETAMDTSTADSTIDTTIGQDMSVLTDANTTIADTSLDTSALDRTVNLGDASVVSMTDADGSVKDTDLDATADEDMGTTVDGSSTSAKSRGGEMWNTKDKVEIVGSRVAVYYDSLESLEGERSKARQILPNYSAWVASSCLMTLARTSYIDRIDLLTADCSLNRHFSVVPMDVLYALRSPADVGSTETTDRSPTDVDLTENIDLSTGESSSSNVTKEKQATEKLSAKNATAKSVQNSSGKVKESSKKFVKHSNLSENSPGNVKQPNKPLEQQQQQPSATDLTSKVYSMKTINDVDLFKSVILKMERYLRPEELNRSVKLAELDSLLPSELREAGSNMFKFVDESGKLGVDERDLQKKMKLPLTKYEKIVSAFVEGAVIFKVGCGWWRLVSRQNARPWLVEVALNHDFADRILGLKTPDECEGVMQDSVCPSSDGATPHHASNIPILFLSRPWRHFHTGTVDANGFRIVAERVLSDLMIRPGRCVDRLCCQLSPNIMPVVVLHVLEILEQIGCVTSVHQKASSKTLLFPGKSSTSSDDVSNTKRCIDVTVEAPLRFACFQRVIQEHSDRLVDYMFNVESGENVEIHRT